MISNTIKYSNDESPTLRLQFQFLFSSFPTSRIFFFLHSFYQFRIESIDPGESRLPFLIKSEKNWDGDIECSRVDIFMKCFPIAAFHHSSAYSFFKALSLKIFSIPLILILPLVPLSLYSFNSYNTHLTLKCLLFSSLKSGTPLHRCGLPW